MGKEESFVLPLDRGESYPLEQTVLTTPPSTTDSVVEDFLNEYLITQRQIHYREYFDTDCL